MQDSYGFQFPHDYPTKKYDYNLDTNDEAHTAEDVGGRIVDNWVDYYPTVKAKYDRRIERFRSIMKSTKPIVVLCRYSINVAKYLQQILCKIYSREDIYIVVSTLENYEDARIVACYTERNGKWNDYLIWNEGIEKIVSKIASS